MATNTVPKKAPRRAPVYFRVERLVRPDTGEIVGALVPLHQTDVRTMRERRYGVGVAVRAELKKPRNPKFWRLAHALGGWLADHVEGFEALAQHDAVKRLQVQSGVGVTEEEFDLGELGMVKRRIAESLNFEDMDEGRFRELWDGWIEWLRREKWGALAPDTLEEVEVLIMGDWQ